MLRSALCLTSLLVASTPALADAPAYDFSLGVHTNLVLDGALALELRVNERFAWSFEVGVAHDIDALGLSVAAGMKYFVAEDFKGFYVGFGGSTAALVDEQGDEVVTRALVHGYFGHKWIFDPGFTVDFNLGPTIIFDEDAYLVDERVVTERTVDAGLNVQLTLGWSF